MTNEKQKIKEELQERLSNITARQQLANLYEAMTTCHKCSSRVGWGDLVCEVCGEELTEFGKN